ncbi:MAG: hypothetical protein CMJ83_19340 [Planctomycetes bacterium]|nr:hypothetical protein [Planctomycetota bacterium]
MPDSQESRLGSLRAGLFLTAMSVLLLQIALTRVFAIIMWHHFAYMVISLALVGFGASGSFITVMRLGEKGGTARIAGRCATIYGAGIALAFFAVTRMRMDSLEIWREPANFLYLLGIYAILAVPFLFAGFAIGVVLTRNPKHVGQLYFSDLLGSAAGGGIAPLLLAEFGSTSVVMLSAFIAMAGGLAFVWPQTKSRLGHGGATVAALALAICFITGAVTWDVPFAPHKEVPTLFPGGTPDRTIHSATAQVDVSRPKVHHMVLGGQVGDIDFRLDIPIRGVTQDGTAPTALYENAVDVKSFAGLDDTQAGTAYVALKAAGRKDHEVLVIGCGGGVDVMIALYHDAKSIIAADINSAMIKMVKEDYADYIGHLFTHPKVDLVHAEGRSFLRGQDHSFDLIQLSGVDTYTALNTGAYTLSESYLYTVEAVKDMYARLKPGGYINYSRFLLTSPKRPRESIRLANIVRTALEELDVAEPWKHVAILQAHGWASTMIRKGPITEPELQSLRDFAKLQRFMGMVFDPGRPRGGPYGKGNTPDLLIQHLAREVILALVQKHLPTAPFPEALHVEYNQAIRLAIDGKQTESDTALEAMVRPIPTDVGTQNAVREELARHRDAFVATRKADGTHFVQVQKDFEIVLRGTDDERTEFVDEYFYDLSPSRDDKPFFFNYSRLSKFWDSWTGNNRWDTEYHPDFPVGHLVLFASMLQIVALAFVLIILPVRKLKAKDPALPRGRVFVYFAALGMGFMFIEIGLMQRFVLFLGHPTYALSVVLCGMLAMSGLGALVSSRIPEPTQSTMTKVLVGILITTGLELWLTGVVFDSLLDAAFPVRVIAALALLAPLAFMLGFPFPLGVRALDRLAPALIPWGWAINGFLSVFSSLAAVVLAMDIGFTWVVVVAGAVYLVGFLAFGRILPLSATKTAG